MQHLPALRAQRRCCYSPFVESVNELTTTAVDGEQHGVPVEHCEPGTEFDSKRRDARDLDKLIERVLGQAGDDRARPFDGFLKHHAVPHGSLVDGWLRHRTGLGCNAELAGEHASVSLDHPAPVGHQLGGQVAGQRVATH